MYEYKARIVRVIDGDTVDVDIDLGFGIFFSNQRIRIMGIDTPESRTRNKLEKVFGIAAKVRLGELLGKTAILRTKIDKSGKDAKGKFGRILGDFVVGDRLVTDILIEEGYCVPYHGGSKSELKELHEANRLKLIESGAVFLPEGLVL